ncbi:hypothetical protein GCM10027403_32880 [Arthrobacter tecti]
MGALGLLQLLPQPFDPFARLACAVRRTLSCRHDSPMLTSGLGNTLADSGTAQDKDWHRRGAGNLIELAGHAVKRKRKAACPA